MKTSELDYDLPRERIAQEPAEPRDAAWLMVLRRSDGAIRHAVVRDLPEFLAPGDVLVLNDTKVVPARVRARRSTGGAVRLLFLGWDAPGRARMIVESRRRLRAAEPLTLDGCLLRPLARQPDGTWLFETSGTFDLERVGEAPLPPYIRRPGGPTARDFERYQTVYARHPGSVAAPTAGLHFTPALLDEVRNRGAQVAFLTLHLGPGTFRPIRADDLSRHTMEAEEYRIPEETLRAVSGARRVIAVGTTVTRALESWARTGAAHGRSGLFIHPPFDFRVVGALWTNFHLPRSTPLALAAAFAGWPCLRRAYEEAVRQGYRFYSYGDAMLIV